VHKGVEAIKRDVNLKDKLKAIAPDVARAIVSKIPGGQAVASVVHHAVKSLVDGTKHDNAGCDIAAQFRANHAVAEYQSMSVTQSDTKVRH